MPEPASPSATTLEIDAPAPAYFFSDAHLGFADAAAERPKRDRLLRFLTAVGESGRSLFCLGDLFDFWFEYETAIPSQHFAVLRRLQELSESGVGLHFLGGNHDWWVRRGGRPGFLEREIGFRMLEEGTVVRTSGLRILPLHGDGVGPRDRGYRLLKVVLRNRVAIGAFRWVHPDLARRIGSLTSRASRLKDGGEPSDEACARLRAHAGALLRSRPDLDVVVAGHTHRPEDLQVGRARYVNLGDWIRRATYAVAQDGMLSLRTFEEAPAGLATEDLPRTGATVAARNQPGASA